MPVTAPSFSGAAHESDSAPSSFARVDRCGRGDAGLLGVELLLLAEPGDDHPPAAAVRRVLVGDAEPLEACLGLAGVDQALEVLVRERAALEEAADARVGLGVARFTLRGL